MTFLRLKNLTHIYRIDAKKLEGERGYLALEDLRIKSKFSRSNMPIREVGRSEERKTPRGRRKKRKKAWTGWPGAGLKHHIGAIDLGANNLGTKLGVKIYDARFGTKINGAKLPTKSPPRLRRAKDLGARIYGAETCKFGATNDGSELRVQILKTYVERHICENFSKRLKILKIWLFRPHK